MLLIYVDDIVITKTDSRLISPLQNRLKESFHKKDLGPVQYFLGLEVLSTPTRTYLHQHKYTELITLDRLRNVQSVDIPLKVN